MSRGPGRWQRAILAAVEAAEDGPVVVTSLVESSDYGTRYSEEIAARRAAHVLEGKGRVRLAKIRGALVAYSTTPHRPAQ